MTLLYVMQLFAKSIPLFTIIHIDSVSLHAKIITTGYQDELDKNMKIENKSTRAEDRPTYVMPVLFV